MLTFVGLLLMGGMNAWAQDQTLIDFTLVSGDGYVSGDVATIEGCGSITFKTGNHETKNSVYGAKLDGGATSKYVKVELVTPLKAGDVIKIREFTSGTPSNDTSAGIDLRDATNSNSVTILYRKASAAKTLETVSYTVSPSDGIDGNKSFYIARGTSSSIYFNGVTITRPATLESGYNVTTSVNPIGAGTITQTPAGISFEEGTEIAFSATANAGYTFQNKWTVNGTEYEGSTYTIESLSSDVTVTAYFVKNPVLTFAKPEGIYCIGSAFPKDVNNVAAGAKYTLPENYMYYKEGYTMTGWEIDGTTYVCGAEYTVANDATLTPVFTKNTISLEGRKSEVTVSYDFDKTKNGGHVINCQSKTDKYIATAKVDGETIDVMFDVDATKGKANSQDRANDLQVNGGTIFYFPVVKGSVITITASNNFNASTTFNGVAGDFSTSKKVVYTATEAGNVKVVDGGSAKYYKTLSITYPLCYTLNMVAKDETTNYDTYSLSLGYDAVIPEGVTAYTGKLSKDGEGNDVLNMTEITSGVIPAETGVVVKASEAADFVKAETAAAAIEDNDLKPVLVATATSEIDAEGGSVLTFGVKNGEFGFRQPAGTTIKANRVYLILPASINPSKGIGMVFGGESTGISEVKTNTEAADAPMYNLAGQRVAAGTKGLLIKNGKKYIVK